MRSVWIWVWIFSVGRCSQGQEKKRDQLPEPAPVTSRATEPPPDPEPFPELVASPEPVIEATPQPQQPPEPLPETPPDLRPTYDQAMAILSQPAYGPCSMCHATQWPRFASFESFSESALSSPYGELTLPALANIIVDCIDPISEKRCSGDPEDPSDNLDYKMPSKFGFDPISATDLETLKEWSKDPSHR